MTPILQRRNYFRRALPCYCLAAASARLLLLQEYAGTLIAKSAPAYKALRGSLAAAPTRNRTEPPKTIAVVHGYPQARNGRGRSGSLRRRMNTAEYAMQYKAT